MPQVGLFAVTRVALGIGVGLLLAGKLSETQRKSVGITLLAVGLITTGPFVAQIFCQD